VDEQPPPKRPSWLTLTVAGAALSVVLYVFTIGSEIGTMRQQTANQEIRIVALETHGSGPVQTAAARVEALTARADRILTELLNMQQKISDLAATQQGQTVMLNRLQEDVAKQGAQR
jgi:hypothetical protein